MSANSTPLPAGRRSVAAGSLGALGTLLMFVVVFVTFLVAPLVALLLAFLCFTVLRSRGTRPDRSAVAPSSPAAEHGFGTGVR